MQKIDFHFNVPNRLRYACLVARTVYKRGLTLAMWSSETKKLTELDELLWRFDDLAFLPHVFADDCHAAETPILLGAVRILSCFPINLSNTLLCPVLRSVTYC